MYEILQSIIQFISDRIILILWVIAMVYFIKNVKKSESGLKWLKDQFEWLKEFFSEDKDLVNAPSHKNLISLAVAAVFCVSYLKKVVLSTDFPDIPSGWQMVLLGILGIRALQGAVEKIATVKYKNGSSDSVNDTLDIVDKNDGDTKNGK